jgi:hypothetical protein
MYPTTLSTNRPARLHLARGEGVEFRVEEVNPEIPVHQDPQEPLADGDEGGRL